MVIYIAMHTNFNLSREVHLPDLREIDFFVVIAVVYISGNM